jgi:hypothetical protein
VVEWPVAGVPVTDVELDGALLAAAAADVDVLWPKDEGPPGSSDDTTISIMS